MFQKTTKVRQSCTHLHTRNIAHASRARQRPQIVFSRSLTGLFKLLVSSEMSCFDSDSMLSWRYFLGHQWVLWGGGLFVCHVSTCFIQQTWIILPSVVSQTKALSITISETPASTNGERVTNDPRNVMWGTCHWDVSEGQSLSGAAHHHQFRAETRRKILTN